MASASGCITLSLALHAALLWSASTQGQPVARREIAIDVTSNVMALGFERETTAAGQGERGASAAAAPPSPRREAASRPPAALVMPSRKLPERPSARPSDGALAKQAEAKQALAEAAATPPIPSPLTPPSPSSPASPTAPTSSATIATVGAATAADDDRASAVAPVAGSAPAAGSGVGTAGTAKGSGPGSRASSAGGDPAGSTAHRAALLDYARRVRARIAEQREYPYAARRAQLHGTVCLRIELSASGRLLGAQPTCGGSLGPLASAALAAVEKASPFPPLPAALGQHLTLDVPVAFELTD